MQGGPGKASNAIEHERGRHHAKDADPGADCGGGCAGHRGPTHLLRTRGRSDHRMRCGSPALLVESVRLVEADEPLVVPEGEVDAFELVGDCVCERL